MANEKFITFMIEKGLSMALSIVVIYAVITLIQKSPKIISEFLDAFRANIKAMENSTEVIKDTKEMHNRMDKKIDDIQRTIEELKHVLVTVQSDNEVCKRELLDKIEKLYEEVEDLKKGPKNL
ncbi:hypothetical protein KQI68_06495 [Peptoniphilus sp. MSJ-1]|uniref:Uncharacterized protein n=1 Tax=Peptoniphilus ovalis TaxID=2841503 RepID=A0ABS6FH28_9FIRM|nr:hypothetical protein [Peptoniphilus ovalis]MBU5669486.1 hypothetical protein [Peptoniphilus ovalis]